MIKKSRKNILKDKTWKRYLGNIQKPEFEKDHGKKWVK